MDRQHAPIPLSSLDLRDLLNNAEIGPAVVVVSGCKSGSFVDELAHPDRLIITASAADRESFGCRDGNEWTDFGKHFFNVDLRADPDPRTAFAAALPAIEAAEFWSLRRPSQPQIDEGSEIGAALDGVLAQVRVKEAAVAP